MRDVDKLLGELLRDEEIESELGRVRAYRRCVRYAEEHLATDHGCNLLLLKAAERLGQQPMAIPVVHNRVGLPEQAKVSFYFSDDEGPVVVGNKAGLRYLGRLFSELARSPLPGENVVLFEGYAPFIGDSYGLTVYLEDEDWFQAAEQGTEDEFVAAWESELQGRIVASEAVAALQLTGPVPSSWSLSPQKIYRVSLIEPWSDEPEVARKAFRQETDRVRVLTMTDDDNRVVRVGLDLDDPDVTFYYDWHLEQFGV